MSTRLAYLRETRTKAVAQLDRMNTFDPRRGAVRAKAKDTTTKLLQAELAAQRDAARRKAKAGTLTGDLDLFLNL